MLVLSRKVGQELVIGDNIRITVNRVGGSRVTLGISAPSDVRIVRGELEPIVNSFEVEIETGEEATPAAETSEPQAALERRLAESKSRPVRAPKTNGVRSDAKGTAPAPNGSPKAGPVNRASSSAVKSAGDTKAAANNGAEPKVAPLDSDSLKRRLH